jgi:hypothetical protein
MTTDPTTARRRTASTRVRARTQADIAARVGQIRGYSAARQAEIRARSPSRAYTADQELREFSSWWDQNVEPHKQSLQAAQEEAAFQRAKDQAEAQRGAGAQGAGTGNQRVQRPGVNPAASPVGPRYEEVMNQIRSAKPGQAGKVDMSGAFTWDAPNPTDMAQNAVSQALKQIDRARVGSPARRCRTTAMDPNALLNRTNYMPGGMPPPPPPGVDQSMQATPAPAPPPLLPPGAAGCPGRRPATVSQYNRWTTRRRTMRPLPRGL